MAKDLTDDKIVALLRIELEQSEGFDADVMADKRAKALDYYFGVMKSSGKGRSNIVSHDVADCVHSLMAQMPGVFLGSAVEFVGMNEQDEKQAELESDVVRAILEANDEFATFDAAAFDGLVQGNGWIGVEVLEDEKNSTETFKGLSDIQRSQLLSQLEQSDNDYEVLEADPDGELFDLTVKLSKVTRSLEVRAIAPERMIFTQAEDQYGLQNLRLVAERRLLTVSELQDLGLSLDEAKAIPTHTDDYWPGQRSREGGKQEVANYNDNENEPGGHQDAENYKETYICYYMLDIDDSGRSERYRIHFGGSQMIEMEPAYCVPYVTGSPLPVPHRIPGQGMYEIMHQIQDAKTDVLRSYIDNLEVMNMGRVGYLKGEVDIEDLLDTRINGAVGCDVIGAVWELPANDIGQQAIMGLNYLDQVRTSRGGASLDMQKAEMQVMASSAYGAGAMTQSKEQMAGLYCKNLAQTLLKHTFLLVHKILRTEWNAPLDAKVRGKWTQADPSQWVERKHARVTVGMTSTEKGAKLQGLTTMITQQTNFMSNGQEGIFTDKSKLFNAMSDWIRTSDLTGNPLEYITDPDSPEAQQAAQAAAQAQQQQQASAEKAQDDNREALLMIETLKAETDKWQTEMTTRLGYYKANLEAEQQGAEAMADKMVEGTKMGIEASKATTPGAEAQAANAKVN